MFFSDIKLFLFVCGIILQQITLGTCSNYWTWKCINEKCMKQRLDSDEIPISPEICDLTCDKYSRLWPIPRGNFEMTRELIAINLDEGYEGSGTDSQTLKKIMARFQHLITIFNKRKSNHLQIEKTTIYFNITNFDDNLKLDLDTKENYMLNIDQNNKNIPSITINATTIFGARHALETLSQVILYNDFSQMYVVPKKLVVEDSPIYPIRGLMIDTARNFISVKTIKKIIEGLAMNKLNTLHWHIIDSQSFPFESISIPELTGLGAYSSDKIYSVKDIKSVVDFAAMRGVRIIPEFDGPAHVGEGWQDSNLVVCFNKKPWGHYCKEPPCGQYDPTKDDLYSTLKMLYKDAIDAFNPELIHFGGDEVNFNCWRSVDSIKQWMKEHNMSPLLDSGYVDLWKYYQDKVYDIFMTERKRVVPAILWTSTLTDAQHIDKLSSDKYIIHVWTDKHDATIRNLIKKNFKIIMSNYDAMYLDCGFHSWTTGIGNNWCSPYITWKQIYENSPKAIVSQFQDVKEKTDLIMGAMTALWTETIDGTSAENKIWPRTAALAERAWAEPESKWDKAQYRLESQRQRMVMRGIYSDTLVPEWCNLNQDTCL